MSGLIQTLSCPITKFSEFSMRELQAVGGATENNTKALGSDKKQKQKSTSAKSIS